MLDVFMRWNFPCETKLDSRFCGVLEFMPERAGVSPDGSFDVDEYERQTSRIFFPANRTGFRDAWRLLRLKAHKFNGYEVFSVWEDESSRLPK